MHATRFIHLGRTRQPLNLARAAGIISGSLALTMTITAMWAAIFFLTAGA